MKRKITENDFIIFKNYLYEDEKSSFTVEKYMRDLRAFREFVGKRELCKADVLSYKEMLGEKYAVASANSMLAAINKFFKFIGRLDLCIKQFRVQKSAFCPAEKELTRDEYRRLVKAAEEKKNERLSLVIQTICSTGIRVSELSYITVEAVMCGQATVYCKSKTRTVLIISALRRKLLRYAKENKLSSGAIFRTKTGKPLDRCNVWREMKALCDSAGVVRGKVFPHNLRHLFARVFYGIEKDIAKLADILGHSNINTTRIYIISYCIL